MWSKYYMDENSGEPVSLQDLEASYNSLKESEPESYACYDTFDYYMNACMWYNNGALHPLTDYYKIGLNSFVPWDEEDAKNGLKWLEESIRKYGCITQAQKEEIISAWESIEEY